MAGIDEKMIYDSKEYWLERGRGYKAEFENFDPLLKLLYWDQGRQVRSFLRRFHFYYNINSILEVGCGFGRMTKILNESFPNATITAIDISPDMLAQARSSIIRSNIKFEQKSLFDLDKDLCFYDLVFAAEVLIHIPPNQIEEALRILRHRSLMHFIHLDWYAPDEPKEMGGYCWQHDYPGEIIPIKDLPILGFWRLGKSRAAIFHEKLMGDKIWKL